MPRKLEASLRGEGDLATGSDSSFKGLRLGAQDKDSIKGWLAGGRISSRAEEGLGQ